MTLLITVFAAVISTAIWYMNDTARQMKVSALCYMFWGAAIMWFVDAIFEYKEMGAAYFTPEIADMANDSFLGLSVIAFALIIWTAIYFIKNPRGIVKSNS